MPNTPINRASGEHYIWGDHCDGWHLVKDPELSVIQELMPAGTAEVLHFHQRAQQFFFILSGEAFMEVDGNEIELKTGDGIHIRPGVRHQIRNSSRQPVEFLVVSHPPSHGDRVVVDGTNVPQEK